MSFEIPFYKRISSMFNSQYIAALCAVVIAVFVDFVRHTQSPIVWYPFVNLLGIGVLLIVLSNIEWKALFMGPNYVFTAFCALLGIGIKVFWYKGLGEFWLAHFGPFLVWQAYAALLNIWLIGVIICGIAFNKNIRKRFNLKFTYKVAIGIVDVLLIIIGNSGDWYPLWFFFIFGLFYSLIMDEEGVTLVHKAAADGILVTFILFQGLALLRRPYDQTFGIQYIGFLCNTNMTALHLLIVLVAVLVELHFLHDKNEPKYKWIRAILYLMLLYVLGLIFCTVSKTGYIGAVLVIVSYGFLVVHGKYKETIGKTIAKGLALLCAFVVAVPIVFASIRFIPAIINRPLYFDNEWNEDVIQRGDAITSDKYVDFNELLGCVFGRLIKDEYNSLESEAFVDKRENNKEAIGSAENVVWVDEETPLIPGLPRALNIRFRIFAAYLEHATWLGRAESDFVYFDSATYDKIWHEQNVFVHVIYRWGFIAGILASLCIIICVIDDYRVFKKEDNPYWVMPFLFSVVFIWVGMTEVVWLSGQFILTLFLLMRKRPNSEARE